MDFCPHGAFAHGHHGDSHRLLLREAVKRAEASDQIHGVNTDGQKCERCWHWETDIGQNAEHPTICCCCVEAVLQFKA
jgi:isoleucyl-tRNA synthetase